MPPPRPPSAAPPPPPVAPPGGGFAMTRPLQQNNPFLQGSSQMGPQSMGQMPTMNAPLHQGQMQGQMYPQQGQMPGMVQYEAPQAPRTMEATALVRPPQSKAPLIIGLIVAALVAVGVAAFFLVPRTGNIAVNVTDSKGGSIGALEVFIDGRKVCDTAPCRIDQVKAGSHELKVSAQGYDQPAPSCRGRVRQGQPGRFPHAPQPRARRGTGFKVTGTQPGVQLVVDNKEVGALPQEVRDLEPGTHQLKFVGTLKSAKGEDRYAPQEKSITVAKDEVQDLGPVTLKVLIGKATITLDTPDAKVKLVASNGDQRTPTQFPVSIEIDTNKSSWTIDATKTGMNELKMPISFDDGQAEKVFSVHLEPKGVQTGGGGGGGGGGVAYVPPHPTGGGVGGGGGGGGTAPSGGAHLTINAIPVAGTGRHPRWSPHRRRSEEGLPGVGGLAHHPLRQLREELAQVDHRDCRRWRVEAGVHEARRVTSSGEHHLDLGHTPRVLVVDDEQGLRDMLSILLRREGYDVSVAPSFSAGARLRSAPRRLSISSSPTS